MQGGLATTSQAPPSLQARGTSGVGFVRPFCRLERLTVSCLILFPFSGCMAVIMRRLNRGCKNTLSLEVGVEIDVEVEEFCTLSGFEDVDGS